MNIEQLQEREWHLQSRHQTKNAEGTICLFLLEEPG